MNDRTLPKPEASAISVMPRRDCAQWLEPLVLEHIDPRSHARGGGRRRDQRDQQEDDSADHFFGAFPSSTDSTAVWIAGRA